MDGCNITRLNDTIPSQGTKGHRILALVKNTRGQISIFFSASLIVLITIIAFVINIGLFVKAKINLQNATDAAAFAGAAVQARQLSTIGYLNWEMRNIYKEWMYKYYVVGNLNIRSVENPPEGPMNFNLDPAVNPIETNAALRTVEDPFNIPAICIHTEGSRTNICRRYAVPGLPEFGPSGLPGAEEASRAFMDALIQGKVLDCGERTALNSLVSATWAYNVLSSDEVDSTLIGRGPAVLSNRQGAWPAAVELAMRMRNLEYAANRAPITEGICLNGSAGSVNCGRSIGDISGEGMLGNERAVKAFYSGYRNLGNSDDSEMKVSFTLTEIPPTPAVIEGESDPSYYLTPEKYQKFYLDLKLMTINLATFYGAMIPTADVSGGGGTQGTSGECVISKVATPVPGYPLGFYKNPDVLTYYAVRGEAEFEGMFNPFGQKIKLTAYSAAKPFGGRIGPALFKQKLNHISGREIGGKKRSVPYLTSLDFVGTPVRDLVTRSFRDLALGEYFPGVPVPINDTGSDGHFWVEDPSKPVGGKVTDGTIQFGIPNLVYDYQELYQNTGYTNGSVAIHKIITKDEATEPIGLYSGEQFRMFKGTRIGSENTTQDLLEEEIDRVRAPTIYEAANYLVPTPNAFNLSSGVDSFGFVPGQGVSRNNGVEQHTFFVYAPLYGGNIGQVDTLWKNQDDVVKTIFEFLRLQESGINKYRNSMNLVAQKLAATGSSLVSSGAVASGSANAYVEAAKQISDISNFTGSLDQKAQSCKSLVGSFLHFYYGHPNLFPGNYVANDEGCPTTLGEQLQTYFTQGGARDGFSPSHYRMKYNWRAENFSKSRHGPEKSFAVFSAYQPGPMTGIGPDGRFQNTITGDSGEFMRRNFYSTKFVALDSLQNGQGFDEKTTNFSIYSEGDTRPGEINQNEFRNPLNASSIGIELNAIKY